MEHLTVAKVDLDLPVVLRTDLDHSLGRTHIEPIDIVPCLDLCFRNGPAYLKYLIEADPWNPSSSLYLSRLDPRDLFLQLQEQAAGDDNNYWDRYDDRYPTVYLSIEQVEFQSCWIPYPLDIFRAEFQETNTLLAET